MPEGAKETAEAAALAAILHGMPMAPDWTALLDDYKNERGPEAQLVRDADRLEFLLQAWVYRETGGNVRLDEAKNAYQGRQFVTPAAQAVAHEILQRWESLGNNG